MFKRIILSLKRRDQNETGFALVELVVVMAIVAILVSIAAPVFANVQKNSKINSLKAASRNGVNVAQAAVNATPARDASAAVDALDTAKINLYLQSTNEANYCVTATSMSNGSVDLTIPPYVAGPRANATNTACTL